MKKAYILAGTAILFWGTYSALGSILLRTVSVAELLFYSGIFASIALFLYSLITGKLQSIKKLTFSLFMEMMFLGLAGVLLYNGLYYFGSTMLLTQQASVTNYLWPIASIVFTAVFSHIRLTKRQITAVLISFLGVMVVATQGDFYNILEINYAGFAFVALGAMGYGVFSALNRHIHIEKSVAMLLYYVELIIGSAAFMWITGAVWHPLTFSVTAGLAFNGVFVFAVAYTAWALAMDFGDPVVISNLAYLTPFCSLIFIFLLLHEPISMASIGGLVLIIAGVVFQMSTKSERNTGGIQKKYRKSERTA